MSSTKCSMAPATQMPMEAAASSATKSTGHFLGSPLSCLLSLLRPCRSLPRQRKNPSEPTDIYLLSENSSAAEAEPSPSLFSCLSVPTFTCCSEKSDFYLPLNFPSITHKHPTQISLRLFLFFFSFFLVTTQQKHFSYINFVTQAEQTIAPQRIPQKPEWSDSVGQDFIQTICPVVRAD